MTLPTVIGESLLNIAEMKSIEEIALFGTRLDEKQVSMLRQKWPKVNILADADVTTVESDGLDAIFGSAVSESVTEMRVSMTRQTEVLTRKQLNCRF